MPLTLVSCGVPQLPAGSHAPSSSRTTRKSPTICKQVVPSSSLLDDLGRVRRVKAKPARAGCFASLDTAATAKGGQLRGGRGRNASVQDDPSGRDEGLDASPEPADQDEEAAG